MSASPTLRIRVLELQPGVDPGASEGSGYDWVTGTIEWTPDPAGMFETHQAGVVWTDYNHIVAIASPVGAAHGMHARWWTINNSVDNAAIVMVERTDSIDLGVTGIPGPMSVAWISGSEQALIQQTFADGDTVVAVRVLWDQFDGFAATNSRLSYDGTPIVTPAVSEYRAMVHDGNNRLIYGPWSDFYITRPDSSSTKVNYIDYNANEDSTTVPAATMGGGVDGGGLVWLHSRDKAGQDYRVWSVENNVSGPFAIPYSIDDSQESVNSHYDSPYVPFPGLTLDDIGGFQEFDALFVTQTWACAGKWGNDDSEVITAYTLYAWSNQMVQSGDIFAGVDSICRAAPDSTGKLRFVSVGDFDTHVGPIYAQLWRWTGKKGEGEVILQQQLPIFDPDEDGNWHTIAPHPNGTTFAFYAPWDPAPTVHPEETLRWRVLDVTGDTSIAWRTDQIEWTPAPSGSARFATGSGAMVWLPEAVSHYTLLAWSMQDANSRDGTDALCRAAPDSLGRLRFLTIGVHGGGPSYYRQVSLYTWLGHSGPVAGDEDIEMQSGRTVFEDPPHTAGDTHNISPHSNGTQFILYAPTDYPSDTVRWEWLDIINDTDMAERTATISWTPQVGQVFRSETCAVVWLTNNSFVYFAVGRYNPTTSSSDPVDRTLWARQYTVTGPPPATSGDPPSGTVTVNRTDSVFLGAAYYRLPGNLAASFLSASNTVLLQEHFGGPIVGGVNLHESMRVTWSPTTGFGTVTRINPAPTAFGATSGKWNSPVVGGGSSDFYTSFDFVPPNNTNPTTTNINFLSPTGTVTTATIPKNISPMPVGIPGTGNVVVVDGDFSTPTDDVQGKVYIASPDGSVTSRDVDTFGVPPSMATNEAWLVQFYTCDALTDDYVAGLGYLDFDDDDPRVWILGPTASD